MLVTMLFKTTVILALLGQALAATDGYLQLKFQNNYLLSSLANNYKNYGEVDTWTMSFDQTLNIGSQTTGTGAGKVVFNGLTVTRRIDAASPKLFEIMASGQAITGTLAVQQATGSDTVSTKPLIVYSFAMMAIQSINWTSTDDSPQEVIEFKFGAISMTYNSVSPSGTSSTTTDGWNAVKNNRCSSTDATQCLNTASKRALFEA